MNVSQNSDFDLINLKRKKVSVKIVSAAVREAYLSTNPKDTSEMYALFPEDPDRQGLRILLTNYFDGKRANYEDYSNNPSEKVTCNDAARLVAIMLDPKHREAIIEWRKNKFGCVTQDQGNPPTKGFFEVLTDDFNDPTSCIAIGLEDTGELVCDPPIDPNDVSTSLVIS
jgi:hypothetical protein